MKKQILILFVALVSAITFGQTVAERKALFNLEKGVAIQGYDAVSYFTQKKAIKGKSTITLTNDGVVYYFSSQTNKEAFAKKPANYD